MSRFDYVAYDEKAQGQQLEAKEQVIVLESLIDGLKSPRARALALTKLEEALMWLQKRTRDRLNRGVEGTNVK